MSNKKGSVRKRHMIPVITAGIICILSALLIFIFLNMPTRCEKTFSFSSVYKEKSVTLKASYWEAENAEYAVLICPGYSCDRQKWRPFADLFTENGFDCMVFDYAGQGGSSSTIGFDNAKTDAIPEEIDDALEVLHEKSGIDYDHIILMGHSMGGRAILRLLYDYNDPDAVTNVTKKEIPAAILFAPEVNYVFNAQASLFAGTSDDTEEPWASYTEADTAGTDIYLYGSTADDIVSDENILSIFKHLGGVNVPESGTWSAVQTNGAGSKITVGITRGVLHSYEMYSPEFAEFANQALEDITGSDTTYAPFHMTLIYVGWVLALAGVGITLFGLCRTGKGRSMPAQETNEKLPVLTDAGKFLRFKLIMWLPGMILAFVICCICVILPFGSPVMNLPYMCCIAGYGLVMLFMYRKGRFPGTEGRLPGIRNRFRARVNLKSVLITAAETVIICLFVWYVLRASMYRLIPVNARLFWVCSAGILMTVGYYVSGCESDMLHAGHAGFKTVLLWNLIQFLALFLLVVFYMVIGSWSGLIGQVQNMVLMYIFCMPLGTLIRRRTGSRAAGAFICGFLFQALMITSAALIAIF